MKVRKINRYIVCSVTVLFLGVSCTSYVAYALTRPLPVVAPNVVLRESQFASQKPIINWPLQGNAAIGAENYGVLATSPDQTPSPTASTIKLLTALAVLKQKPFISSGSSPTLLLDSRDVEYYNQQVANDGSVVKVEDGELITEYQALQALLLPSANNMADSLAAWAYGSTDAYLAAANKLAISLGMSHTTIDDPSGVSPLTTSTPSDLVKLGIAALNQPIIAAITSQASAFIPVEGTVSNVNKLIGYQGVIGLKTGNTNAAGGCFIGARTVSVADKDIAIVTAILNASDLDQALDETLPLSVSAANGFGSISVIHKGTTIATYTIPWRSNPIKAITDEDLSVFEWKGQPVQLTYSLPSMRTYDKAREVGSVIAHLGGDKRMVHLALDHPISPPSWQWRLTHVF